MACCLTAKKKKEKTNKKLRLISYNQISIKRKKKGTRKIPHDTKIGTNKQAKKKYTYTYTHRHTPTYISRENVCIYFSISHTSTTNYLHLNGN